MDCAIRERAASYPFVVMPIKAQAGKTPKYLEIAEGFRRDIAAGVLRPGDRLPSFAEMRAQLGIGQGTLERVHQVLEKENLIVREASRGVFVADTAAHQAGKQTKPGTGVLGICGTHSLGRNFVYEAKLLQGVQKVVAQVGFELRLLSADNAIGWDKVDGILHYYGSGKLAHLPPATPNVSLLIPRAGFNCVLADDAGGAEAATRHLLELGHRKIALLTTREKNFHTRRLAGYEKALRNAGIEPRPEWVRPISSFERQQGYIGSGRETMREWLATDWRELGCTALLTQNDDTAIGAIHACVEAKISVPEELSIAGFDGAEAAEWFLPRLTTMQVPFEEIGERGAQLLIELIQNPSARVTEINLPVTLRTGDTSRKRVGTNTLKIARKKIPVS